MLWISPPYVNRVEKNKGGKEQHSTREICDHQDIFDVFEVSYLKIRTELSVSKIIFYEIALCHVKYIEIDAFFVRVYMQVTQQAKPVAKFYFSH